MHSKLLRGSPWLMVLSACGADAEMMPAEPLSTPTIVAVPTTQRFSRSLEVRLEASAGTDVFYTLDGSAPNDDDAIPYGDLPIVLDSTTLVTFVARRGELWSLPGSELYERRDPIAPFRPPARALEVSDDAIFFTADTRNAVMEDVLVLRSVGTEAVRLDAVYIAAQGGFFEDGVFEVDEPNQLFLEPGEELRLTLRYHVRDTLRTAALILETDGLRTPNGQWVITLGGRMAAW